MLIVGGYTNQWGNVKNPLGESLSTQGFEHSSCVYSCLIDINSGESRQNDQLFKQLKHYKSFRNDILPKAQKGRTTKGLIFDMRLGMKSSASHT
jgi:hypothetical protein